MAQQQQAMGQRLSLVLLPLLQGVRSYHQQQQQHQQRSTAMRSPAAWSSCCAAACRVCSA
jgi:hypothetical protein